MQALHLPCWGNEKHMGLLRAYMAYSISGNSCKGELCTFQGTTQQLATSTHKR